MPVDGNGNDYLSTPSMDTAAGLAKRTLLLSQRRPVLGYQNLETAGIQKVGLDVYAKNITIPSGPIGAQFLAAGVALLTDEVVGVSLANNALVAAGIAANPTLEKLSDYEKLYEVWGPTPIGVHGWDTDYHFGRLRLTYLPMNLRLTTELPSFAVGSVNTREYSRATLEAALAAQQLFHTDLDFVTRGVPPTDPAFVTCKCSYVLYRNSAPHVNDSAMMPVGILISGVWYTPEDGDAWRLAKLQANCVEGNLQPLTHFEDVHLMHNTLAIVSQRQLAPQHPVRALLEPTLEYVVGLAVVGMRGLFNPGTEYDTISAWGGSCMHRIYNRDFNRPFYSHSFDTVMAERQMGPAQLASFPYRDDMARFQTIIRRRLQQFINIYYPDDAAIAADHELQGWAAETANPSLGNIPGFPSSFPTRASLVDALSHIQLAVVKHHALMTQVYNAAALTLPHIPMRIYCTMPAMKSAVTDSWIVQQCMPSLSLAHRQIAHAVGFDRPFAPGTALLYSPLTASTGTRDTASRAELYASYQQMSREIGARYSPNATLPYIYLDPRLMPRSGFA